MNIFETPNTTEHSETSTPNKKTRAPAAASADAAGHARESRQRGSRRRATHEKKSGVVTELRLGPRSAEATHWKCRRLEGDTDRKGRPLSWGAGDGFEDREWSLETCSSDIVNQRWGPGRYIVDYLTVGEDGKRRPCGHSRVFHIIARSAKAPETAPVAVASPPATPAHIPDLNASTLFQLFAYIDDRNEKARQAAASEARAMHDRYRTDLQFSMERERLASQERIAQLEAQARTVPTRGGHIDPDALAQRIGEVVGNKMQQVIEDQFDAAPESEAGPPPPPDNTVAMIAALKDTLAPILSLVVAKLAAGPTLPDTALPPIPGDKGGKDPKDGAN
jgi:hypothetical protein